MRPFILFLWRRLGFSHATRDAIHHLPGLSFNGLVDMLQIARDPFAVEQLYGDLRQVDVDRSADFALAGLGVDDHNHRVADRQATASHVLLGITIKKNLVTEVVKLAGGGL